jgi:catalase
MQQDKCDGVPVCLSVAPCSVPPRHGLEAPSQRQAKRDLQAADNDYHRRDLWEAINSGNFPEWELGFQLFDQKFADAQPYDVLDPTKIIPEEVIPVGPVGRMVLDRNPDKGYAAR